MLSPFDADYAWPPGFAAALRDKGFVPDLESWKEDWTSTWGDLEKHLAIKEEALLELLDGDDWRLAFCVFKSPDVIAHKSYGAHLQENLAPLYERLDGLLGRLLLRVGPDTNVLLISDHGFRSYKRGFNLHAWLAAEGFAQRKRGSPSKLLSQGVIEEMVRSERSDLLAELELERTSAYATRCEGNFGSLRLNLHNREPQGSLRAEDREETLAAIEARLRSHPQITQVWRSEELYPGPHRASLPDLMFETLEGVQVFAERGQHVVGNYPHELHDHDRHGIFVASGPAWKHNTQAETLDLIDIAPTVLYLLEEAVPMNMQGRVPLPWMVAGREVVYSAPEAEPETREERPFTAVELRELEKRLRALGYGE
jgi:predicted AlkP superfamily phosphohydrolase/phosphomutase